MRVHTWSVPVVSLLFVLSAGDDSTAETPQGQTHSPQSLFHATGSGDAAYQFMAGDPQGMGAAPRGAMPPPANDAGGYPPSLTAWPSLSPHDNRYAQHAIENGMWQLDTNRRPKKYFFDAELILGNRRAPKGIIGAVGATKYIELFPLDATVDIRSIRDAVDGDPESGRPGYNYYDAQDASVLGESRGLGTQLRWGYFNPDDSGLSLTFSWIDLDANWSAIQNSTRQLENTAIFEEALQSGDPVAFDYGSDLDFGQVLQQNLLLLGGLPLNDGTMRWYDDGNYTGGITAPYDLDFTFRMKSERYGAGATWYLSGGHKSRWLKVRPLVGVKYVQLNEEFSFHGRDSGLLYDSETQGDPLIPDLKLQSLPDGFDQDGNGIVDDAAAIEEIGATQDLIDSLEDQIDDALADLVLAVAIGDAALIAQVQARLDALQDALASAQAQLIQRTVGRFEVNSPPIESYLRSRVRSHMAGPEIGLRFDIGGDGDGFAVWGESRFALLANHERIQLDGDNIGMTTRPADFLQPTSEDAQRNRFNDQESHTHVSPYFEQSIYAEAPIFEHLPVLRKVRLLENAQFRVGYTFTYIGFVAEPEKSWIPQGAPSQGLFPLVSVSRGKWLADQWTFAIDWRY